MRERLNSIVVTIVGTALVITGLASCSNDTESKPSAATTAADFDITWEFPEVTVAPDVEQVIGQQGVQAAVVVAEVAVRDWMANAAVLDYETTYQVSDFDGLRRLLTADARTAFDAALTSSFESFADEDGMPTQATMDVQALALYRLDGDTEFADDDGPWVVNPRINSIAVTLSEDGSPVVAVDATVDLRMVDQQGNPILAEIRRETSYSLTRVKQDWRIYSWSGQVVSAKTRPA